MKDGVTKVIGSLGEFWKKLEAKTKKTVVILSIVVLAAAIGLSVLLNQPYKEVLYSGLKQTDMTTIIGTLQTDGIPFELRNGDTILVPSGRIADLKMTFATLGVPKSTPNYDYFDKNIGSWTTDAEKTRIALNDLQLRLQSNIESMEPVRTATVFITAPKNDGYVLSDNKVVATASVTLDLAAELTDAQINGIKRIISASVPDLAVGNVVVVDSTGVELGGSLGSATNVSITNFKQDVEKQYQKDVESSILRLIGPIYGPENIRIVVKSDFNVDTKIIENLTYNPVNPDTNTGVLAGGSTDKNTQLNQGGAGGIPGTTTNAEVPGYPNVTVSGNIVTATDSQTYQYAVSQVKEQIQHDAAELRSVSVSLSVNQRTMDGTMRQNITDLIATASGAPTQNITILSSTWLENPTAPPVVPGTVSLEELLKDPLFLGILLAAGGLVVVLIFVLIFASAARRKKKKKLRALELSVKQAQARQQEENEANALPPLSMSESMGVAMQKEIQSFAQHNPEIAAQLIRTWLKGSEAGG